MSEDSSSNKGANVINDGVIRIVMVGKTGAGKSATGNTILGFEAFKSEFSTESLTINCQKVATNIQNNTNIAVVDTPGLFDTKFSMDKTLKEIKQSICFSSPGPHVFLFVIKLGRFTEEEQQTVTILQEAFGDKSNGYTMILFTGGDQLKDETAEGLVNKNLKLQESIKKCGNRYHVFNNENKDPSQVTELLMKINKMLEKNGGSHYTTKMFQDAEKQIEGKKQKILKKNENKKRKEEDKLKKEYEEDPEELKKQLERLNERYDQEARERAEKNNKFLTYGLLGAAGGAACGACAGASAGLVFGPVGSTICGVFGGCIGGFLGGAAGGDASSSTGAAIAGVQAVGAIGKAMKGNCVTQ